MIQNSLFDAFNSFVDRRTLRAYETVRDTAECRELDMRIRNLSQELIHSSDAVNSLLDAENAVADILSQACYRQGFSDALKLAVD